MESPTETSSPWRSFLIPLFLSLVLLYVFTAMRVYRLTDRPMHNDEGVNGWFLTNLVKSNTYKYDPSNYHGPSLYYIQLIPTWVATIAKDGFSNFFTVTMDGVNDTSLRSGVVAAGLLVLVGLLLAFHRLGPWGALSAYFLAGMSCSMIFYSRYFIHEIFVVLFTLGIYLGLSYFSDKGKSFFLYVAVISASLLFCTKETSVVTYVVMALAWACSEVTYTYRRGMSWSTSVISMRKERRRVITSLITENPWALYLAVIIWIVLYTSFFKNWNGLMDSFKTYFKWTKEGMESGHNKPIPYYFSVILWPYERGLLIASLVGIWRAFKKNDRQGLFLGFWTMGIFAAYSLIHYKTPWLVINMLLPMALAAGFGVKDLLTQIDSKEDPFQRRAFRGLLFISVLFLGLFQLQKTILVNYHQYDSDSHPQPYVHTSRDMNEFLARVKEIADRSHFGNDIKINFVCKEYWPLPYSLREYPKALFWGQMATLSDVDAPMIVADMDQKEALLKKLKGHYKIENYSLRNNRSFDLYIDQTYAANDTSDVLPDVFSPVMTPENLISGLHKRVFYGRRWKGEMIEEKFGQTDFDFDLGPDDTRYPIPFSIIWEGYIKMEENGPVTFALDSDDGSKLYIDDHLVVDNDDPHALAKVSKEISLNAGYHRVRLYYFDIGGSKNLHWTWKMGISLEESVPKNVLYSENQPSRSKKS